MPKPTATAATQPLASTSRRGSQGGSQTQASMSDFLQTGTLRKGFGLPAAEALQLARSTVYYILVEKTMDTAANRMDLIKTVMAHHDSKYYPQVIEKAAEILLHVRIVQF